jgi:hypothetical protein
LKAIHPSISLFLGSFSLEWELIPLKRVPSNVGKMCRIKAPSIPKIRGIGKDGCRVQPCILGIVGS